MILLGRSDFIYMDGVFYGVLFFCFMIGLGLKKKRIVC